MIPPSNRLHIAVFGRKNVGKSTLLNALANTNAATITDEPGTTKESFYHYMELEPIGSVALIDTVGFDEYHDSEMSEMQAQKLGEVMDQTDLALLLFMDTNEDYHLEQQWYRELVKRHIPVLGVVNRIDDRYVDVQPIKIQFGGIPIVKISAQKKINLNRLIQSLHRTAPLEFERSTIIGDLVRPRDLVLIVSPAGLKAPRYRLPMIHTQLVRDIMDQRAISVTASEQQLSDMLACLSQKPNLVITETDSIDHVIKQIPEDVAVTTFSLLLARFKGDINILLKGAKAIDDLRPGDRILVAEVCETHELSGDVDGEWISERLNQKAGGGLQFEACNGLAFPADLSSYKMILHCGSCMFNRKQLVARLSTAVTQKVPITSYGIALSYLNGTLERIIPQAIL